MTFKSYFHLLPITNQNYADTLKMEIRIVVVKKFSIKYSISCKYEKVE